MIFHISKIEDFEKVIQYISQTFKNEKIFTLEGNLGAGKTTFVKAYCKTQGIDENISSPTFSIVNEYLLPDQQRVYHMDLYRLNDPYELIEFGFEEYLYSGNICFIEWPQIGADLLPTDHVKILIEIIDESNRKVVVLPNRPTKDHE